MAHQIIQEANDLIKRGTALHERVKDLETKRALAEQRVQDAKSALYDLDREMQEAKGFSPLSLVEEKGVEGAYYYVVNVWLPKLLHTTQEQVEHSEKIISSIENGDHESLVSVLDLPTDTTVPVDAPDVVVDDSEVPEVDLADIMPESTTPNVEPLVSNTSARPQRVKPQGVPTVEAPAPITVETDNPSPSEGSNNGAWGSGVFSQGNSGTADLGGSISSFFSSSRGE